ncbi:hypothetical protein B0T26DRAFT_704804 [Lasiosphaeria miniovina]|uniref:Zn(2)-C6 fungal-type domain-containing protein n=1 Tax=Lasiosphaeria miniovina TaxID=1954250 RepID=A0AA40E0Y6_9PEZI|nr:uncharacterized protein B0T26DRAFT_704804 [Lasiosphaeria miniovina]KAK0722960.1 hypothetical protein B0T26DRAFT_704804 [Lasiosphaeria miniovina]
MAIRKMNNNARVQKKKTTTTTSISSSLESTLSSSNLSAGSNGSGGSSGGSSKFFVVTPESVNAHADKPNPFECFETAMRQSQRGRKGPLASGTKESALQVRRVGACFCCHARKVKCDKERPCRNCQKLKLQVPEAMCWQFPDFLQVLFPEFIRGHFRKDEMSKFLADNIKDFTVDGVAKPCTVELFSGNGFRAVLSVRAKFFTAKTADVLQHWHMQVGGNKLDLQTRKAVPIGLETAATADGAGGSAVPHKDELKKKAREYIQAMVSEPRYAELVTESLRHTALPRQVLRIVQDYSERSGSGMVKRALSIYAMHYVMTRHLCLTQRAVATLGPSKLVPQNTPWVTPRVLNRQIKAVVDDMMLREMQLLFETFNKSLKPKSRKEWAPCLAAFLVLCLFMESVETAADTFVISENEISLRSRLAPVWKRSFALGVNREVENMPFKQFAFQFHQIYQTHSRDAAARSFNPLVDDACIAQGELDSDAADMVRKLRWFLDDPQWAELDFLTADPILPNEEEHPYPRDVAFNYTGRLVAKFLLSFTDETYIFGRSSSST